MHSESIVEERRCSVAPVYEEAVKSAIQSRGKILIIFGQMNQILRSRWVEFMS
jgi:hypothetical protein